MATIRVNNDLEDFSVDLCVNEGRPTITIKDYSGNSENVVVPESIGGFTVVDGVLFDKAMTTRIHIPQSLIGRTYSLSSCSALTDITVSEHNPEYSGIDGVLFNKGGTTLLRYPKGRENKDYVVPDGVTLIGGSAFDNCERLGAVTLPMGLQYIGEGAFDGCKNLETVTLSRKARMMYKALKGFSGKLVYRD